MSNLFRQTYDGKLDRGYLRLCAVYKFLKSGRITKERAVELTGKRATIETWSFK